jgi:hypothetical protein
MEDKDPEFVGLLGDVHGNLKWTLHALEALDGQFAQAGETRKIVIQLGDFGFKLMEPAAWTAGLMPIQQLDNALVELGMELWWIDGNHEWWPEIQELLAAYEQPHDYPLRLRGFQAISYLPRGTRWNWNSKTWLAVGGAVSVDRHSRTEGVDWWPDEQITREQADSIIADGPADVLLSHDVPDCWVPSLPRPHESWKPMIHIARQHSRLLQDIAIRTKVTRVFHGHYHLFHETLHERALVNAPPVLVTGLHYDGNDSNIRLIDTRTLR